MEDYFVIILTLVIAVVGALNRKKKKKAPNVPLAEDAQSGNDLWDLIMNEEQDPITEMYEEELVPEPIVEERNEPSKRQVYSFNASNEGKSVVEETPVLKKTKKRKTLIAGEEFSLKKAVIYSEVMNRKYS